LTLAVSEATKSKFKRFVANSPTVIPVHGIGELAYQQGGMFKSLTVFAKGYSLMVVIPEGHDLRWAKGVVNEALARLP
jgi:hypothetical protein